MTDKVLTTGWLPSQIKAKQVFLPGDRVFVSLFGLRSGVIPAPKQIGTVTGYARDVSHCVRVRVDGKKRAESYAWWFWERWPEKSKRRSRLHGS